MTWKHVTLVMCALIAVVICAHNHTCIAALPTVNTLATMMISGALGHAGALHQTKNGVRKKSNEN